MLTSLRRFQMCPATPATLENLCAEAVFDCAEKLEEMVVFLQALCPRVALRLAFTGVLSRPLDLVMASTTEWFALEDDGVGLLGSHICVWSPPPAMTHLRISADCHVSLLGSEVGVPGVRSGAPNAGTP